MKDYSNLPGHDLVMEERLAWQEEQRCLTCHFFNEDRKGMYHSCNYPFDIKWERSKATLEVVCGSRREKH